MISKWKTYAKTATTCLAFTWVANEIHKKISSTPIQKRFTYSSGQTSPIIPLKLARSLDAILVLGGGRPTSLASPPSFVKSRCDAAAKTALSVSPPPAILALSAGTAHVAQLMEGGLPVWESTASVGYIGEHYPIPPDRLFAETSSYDTISNAFFARTSFTDVNGWRRLLIVTNEFHVDRAEAIFQWIFGDGYQLYFLACSNDGLSEEAVAARREHEARGAKNVRENLSIEYTTLREVWSFLTSAHDFYNASKLAMPKKAKMEDLALMQSYGG